MTKNGNSKFFLRENHLSKLIFENHSQKPKKNNRWIQVNLRPRGNFGKNWYATIPLQCTQS